MFYVALNYKINLLEKYLANSKISNIIASQIRLYTILELIATIDQTKNIF